MGKIYKIVSAMEGQTQSYSLKPRTVRMRVLQEVPLLKEQCPRSGVASWIRI